VIGAVFVVLVEKKTPPEPSSAELSLFLFGTTEFSLVVVDVVAVLVDEMRLLKLFLNNLLPLLYSNAVALIDEFSLSFDVTISLSLSSGSVSLKFVID
jgi:hypothetical protein